MLTPNDKLQIDGCAVGLLEGEGWNLGRGTWTRDTGTLTFTVLSEVIYVVWLVIYGHIRCILGNIRLYALYNCTVIHAVCLVICEVIYVVYVGLLEGPREGHLDKRHRHAHLHCPLGGNIRIHAW